MALLLSTLLSEIELQLQGLNPTDDARLDRYYLKEVLDTWTAAAIAAKYENDIKLLGRRAKVPSELRRTFVVPVVNSEATLPAVPLDIGPTMGIVKVFYKNAAGTEIQIGQIAPGGAQTAVVLGYAGFYRVGDTLRFINAPYLTEIRLDLVTLGGAIDVPADGYYNWDVPYPLPQELRGAVVQKCIEVVGRGLSVPADTKNNERDDPAAQPTSAN